MSASSDLGKIFVRWFSIFFLFLFEIRNNIEEEEEEVDEDEDDASAWLEEGCFLVVASDFDGR